MGEHRSIETRMAEAASRWPHVQLKRKTPTEAAGPCPFCGGRDRFRVWSAGNYECRAGLGHCGRSGWLDEENPRQLTEAERLQLRVEELERKQREHEERLSVLERMAKCTDHLRYHNQLDERSIAYWVGEGMKARTIDRWRLGWCRSCPTDKEHRSSYTIPVVNAGRLVNIRHRLVGANGGDKYRPHMAGLGACLFNSDVLDEPGEVILAEGEKKTIILDQSGFRAVGICGARTFKREWVAAFDRAHTVYVALDQDAVEAAERIAALFGKRGRVVDCVKKIDDMIVKHGASADNIRAFLSLARPVS